MEKIWITGAKGHVGTALSALLDCREYEMMLTKSMLQTLKLSTIMQELIVLISLSTALVTVMLQAAKLILTKHLR